MENKENVVLDTSVLTAALGNDVESLREIVEAYMQTLPKYLSELEAATNAGDMERVKQAAHSIKGGAANLGGERLRTVASVIEEAAFRKDDETCRAKLPTILSEYNCLKLVLEKETWESA